MITKSSNINLLKHLRLSADKIYPFEHKPQAVVLARVLPDSQLYISLFTTVADKESEKNDE